MTFRQVEIFLAVARARNFTRAAETLHVSQSTLSQHVLELERELGVRLFDRLGRAVALTEAGRLLEDHAARITTTVASARRALDELKGLERGSLVIGASTTPGIYVLPGLVAAFRRRYPGIAVSLRIGNSRVIEERIRAIKQAVMAGLGVAFVSMHAVRGELATRRLCGLRLKGLRIRRH